MRARKEGKKKGKRKLKDLMKKRGNKEDLKKKGVIKNVDDVRKAVYFFFGSAPKQRVVSVLCLQITIT